MKGILKRHYGSIAFTVLLTASLVILFNRKGGTLSRKTSNFIPGNTAAIDRIVIGQHGEDLVLERKEDGKWMVNDGSGVRKERMDLLFAFMDRLEIVSPVSKKIRDEMIKQLEEEGRRVQLYIHGRIDKDFRICYDSVDIRGTYMMLVKTETPFRVRLKGYPVDDLEAIFATDRKNWQENVLFDLGPDEIREIAVDYPANGRNSYHIYSNGSGRFRLSGETGPVPDDQTDVQEISDYMYFFSNIPFEYPQEKINDSRLVSDSPFVLLHVVTRTGHDYDMKGYRLSMNAGNPDNIDMRRFMGLIHDDQDTVILEYMELDPILRRLEDFQKK